MLALLYGQTAHRDAASVEADLQGLYYEISQATLQFETASDVDQFHDVLYTSDWVFIDANGRQHSWPEVRDAAVAALEPPRIEWMEQSIQTLSPVPGGATVLVNVTTLRTIVDHEGRYGREDDSHTLIETTVFRDRWVQGSDDWKLKSREQIGPPKVHVEKRPLSSGR